MMTESLRTLTLSALAVFSTTCWITSNMLEVPSPVVEVVEGIVSVQTEHVHVAGHLQSVLAREAHGRDPWEPPLPLPDVVEDPGPHPDLPGLQADVEVSHERRGPRSCQSPVRRELPEAGSQAWGDLTREPANLSPPPGQALSLHSKPVEEE